MPQNAKIIVKEGISFRTGKFKNDSTMVEKLPEELKKRILQYLKKPEPGTIGDMPLIDPVTGARYGHSNMLREKDGFKWNTAVIYMFEKYDIKLTDDFLKLFK